MKYKMYRRIQHFAAFASVFFLAACATTNSRSGEDGREPASSEDQNIREPASLVGNYEWLNEVQEDFSRIADETSSNRGVASGQPDVLVQCTRWSFLFNPVSNRFSVRLDNTNYWMVKTNLDDNDSFSFAAEGQAETPLTLTVAVTRSEERTPAQAATATPVIVPTACDIELSFWDGKNKRYQKEPASIQGERCARVVEQLRSYVP